MTRESHSDHGSSPMHLLHRAGQCAHCLFEAGAKESGLTARQFAVLNAVAKSENVNQTDLVSRTGIDRSTMSDIVGRLDKSRLLQRHRTKTDGRAYAVAITDKGRQALRTVEPIAKRIDEQVLAALTNKQRAQLIEALKAIVESIPLGSATGG
jgi:DNA-binding MarR family transcriptional regulator